MQTCEQMQRRQQRARAFQALSHANKFPGMFACDKFMVVMLYAGHKRIVIVV
jgi:hypothetical protein